MQLNQTYPLPSHLFSKSHQLFQLLFIQHAQARGFQEPVLEGLDFCLQQLILLLQ